MDLKKRTKSFKKSIPLEYVGVLTGRGRRTPGRRPWAVREYNDGDGDGLGHGDDGGDRRHHDDDDGDDDDIDDIKERGTHLVCCLGQRQNKTTDCYLIPTYSYCPLSHMVMWFPVSCLTKNSHQQITL